MFRTGGKISRVEKAANRNQIEHMICLIYIQQCHLLTSFLICMCAMCQGLRPELPQNGHPKLLDLMQRCWEAVPDNRPTFAKIKVELEELLQEVKVELEHVKSTSDH